MIWLKISEISDGICHVVIELHEISSLIPQCLTGRRRLRSSPDTKIMTKFFIFPTFSFFRRHYYGQFFARVGRSYQEVDIGIPEMSLFLREYWNWGKCRRSFQRGWVLVSFLYCIQCQHLKNRYVSFNMCSCHPKMRGRRKRENVLF